MIALVIILLGLVVYGVVWFVVSAAPSAVKTRYGSDYVAALAVATKELYDFLAALNDVQRCRRELQELPGLEQIDSSSDTFSIDKRLAVIAFCDARDCLRELGHSLVNLNTPEGLGLVMLTALIIKRDTNLVQLASLRNSQTLADNVAQLANGGVDVNVTGDGFDDQFRFCVIFGVMYSEREWVQRYATLMYRWASVIAKADGVISEHESAVLAHIMKMRNLRRGEGVRVNVGTDGTAYKEIGGNIRTSAAAADGGGVDGGVEAALEALDSLAGLAPVKAEVRRLVSFIQIQEKRRLAGMKLAPVSYHLVFTGNPGTGKTTVARIIADIYRGLGIVKKGQLVETDRSGMVAEYVGQTAVKTNKVIDSALDGVLFIDEAYSLVQGGHGDFGPEAISALLKRMEDDRDRLVVILAGYTADMEAFIESNPGLRSRFNHYIEFPDYSAEELSEIFISMAEKSQYRCSDEVRASIRDIMARAAHSGDRNFGNARYVRNLFENAIQRQAERLSSVAPLTREMLEELTLHDLGFKYDD